MACRISELILDCVDPERLATFWSAVLGYEEFSRDSDYVAIGPPGVGFGGPQPILVLSRSDDPRPAKLQLHIDVSPTDTDQDTELARLFALGAQTADVGQTGEESWHVLADPEGNVFCLLRTKVDPA